MIDLFSVPLPRAVRSVEQWGWSQDPKRRHQSSLRISTSRSCCALLPRSFSALCWEEKWPMRPISSASTWMISYRERSKCFRWTVSLISQYSFFSLTGESYGKTKKRDHCSSLRFCIQIWNLNFSHELEVDDTEDDEDSEYRSNRDNDVEKVSDSTLFYSYVANSVDVYKKMRKMIHLILFVRDWWK